MLLGLGFNDVLFKSCTIHANMQVNWFILMLRIVEKCMLSCMFLLPVCVCWMSVIQVG